jgi:carbon-monoxide dehydrogenase iron sulfur subunit
MPKRLKKVVVFYEDRCLSCRSCELLCSVSHTVSKEIVAAVARREAPVRRRWMKSSPTNRVSVGCQHCEPAPCVQACISAAMTKGGDGETLHDPERCVGCWMCVMVCPFGAIRRVPEKKRVVKCDLCAESDAPACVEGCPTKALRICVVEEE